MDLYDLCSEGSVTLRVILEIIEHTQVTMRPIKIVLKDSFWLWN